MWKLNYYISSKCTAGVTGVLCKNIKLMTQALGFMLNNELFIRTCLNKSCTSCLITQEHTVKNKKKKKEKKAKKSKKEKKKKVKKEKREQEDGASDSSQVFVCFWCMCLCESICVLLCSSWSFLGFWGWVGGRFDPIRRRRETLEGGTGGHTH